MGSRNLVQEMTEQNNRKLNITEVQTTLSLHIILEKL